MRLVLPQSASPLSADVMRRRWPPGGGGRVVIGNGRVPGHRRFYRGAMPAAEKWLTRVWPCASLYEPRHVR